MKDIEDVREDLLKSVEALTDLQINKVVEEGVWSVAQNLEHLYLLEMAVAKGIKHVLTQEEFKPVKEKPIHLAVDRTTKIAAPPYLEPSTDFQTLGTLKNKLAQAREALLQSVQGLTEREMKEKSFKHPVFGTLAIQQWIAFVGYHEERHLLQIEEVKQRLS
ncbi:MAG: DinB family protein [Lysinibacillus sp.]